MTVPGYQQYPTDVLDYQMDWADWLESGDVIATSVWTVPSGLTGSSATNTQTTATIFLTGGTAGQQYVLSNKITTTAGRTETRSFTLSVLSAPQPASWTYDPTAMASTEDGHFADTTVGVRNQIRLLIQDTVSTRPLLQDAELDWFQTQEANAHMAAAAACDSLVSRGGSVKSKTVGDLSITYDVEFYRALAASLRGRGATYQMPYAGGISVSDKRANQVNTDNVGPAFARGIEQNPGAPQPTIPPAVPTNEGA